MSRGPDAEGVRRATEMSNLEQGGGESPKRGS